jgi:hypothetical protein
MEDKEILCKCCNEIVEVEEVYNVYCIMVHTDKQSYYIGLFNLFEKLGDYLMSKHYHLSASQIILLRPDVVSEYLRQKFEGEKVIEWYIEGYRICEECFGEYINLTPLR